MEEVQRHSLVKPGMRKNSLNLFQFTWIIDRLPLVAKRQDSISTHPPLEKCGGKSTKLRVKRLLSYQLCDFRKVI